MNSPEFQPEPAEEISPLRRYFSDLHYKRGSYIDMKIAAEKYVLACGVTRDEDMASALVDVHLQEYVPGDGRRNREIRDMLTTLPLFLVSDYADTRMNLRDARKWYKETLDYIAARQHKDHSFQCLEHPSFAFKAALCEHSDNCPVITTAKVLDEHIFDTEDHMRTPFYTEDPLGVFEVTVMKQRLAAEYGYVHGTVAARRIEEYAQVFRNVHGVNGE